MCNVPCIAEGGFFGEGLAPKEEYIMWKLMKAIFQINRM